MSSLFAPWLPTTICAFLIPFALRRLPMFRNPSSGPHPGPPPAPTPLRTPISALLALYILYTLYTLIFARPPNLFTALRLPLNAPQSTIHSALLLQHLQQLPLDHRQSLSAAAANGSTVTPVLPPALEKLLARLASSDARTILVRCVFRSLFCFLAICSFSSSIPSVFELSIFFFIKKKPWMNRQLWPARHPDLFSLRDGSRLCPTCSSARLTLLYASGGHARSRNGARDSARSTS